MARLLQIESCPRSCPLTKVFLDVYKEIHPLDTIEVMNLWKIDMPPVIGEMLEAKYAGFDSHEWTSDNRDAWQIIERYVEHFTSADKYLFTIPTWCIGIPYVLKEYIDMITQSGLLFEFVPNGTTRGLVADRPACILCAHEGCTGPGSGSDPLALQCSFMSSWLKFIGITQIYSVFDEPADVGMLLIQQLREKAEKEAINIANSF